MFTKPLVSVILPNYNHGKYLKERINSILNQDYANFELFILDDCSTDNSREIIESYRGNKHVRGIIYNEKNTGNTFVQWKKGIGMANADYVWIAESDDVAEPTFLSMMMQKLLSHDDAVLTFSHSRIINADGEEQTNVWDNRSRYVADGAYDSRFFCLTRMLFYNAPYNASMVVFRKKYVSALSEEYMQYRHNGDYLFWFMMCMQGRVLEVRHKLNGFRQHDNKVSASGHDEAFLENAAIVSRGMLMMNLSSYQRRCLRGKYLKRWKRAKVCTKHEARASFPEVYGGNTLDTIIYTFDKVVNLSGMQG